MSSALIDLWLLFWQSGQMVMTVKETWPQQLSFGHELGARIVPALHFSFFYNMEWKQIIEKRIMNEKSVCRRNPPSNDHLSKMRI
jgi:hypothetical protein